jgi:hypothetical protein
MQTRSVALLLLTAAASLIVAAATLAGCRADYVPVSASCIVYHSGIHVAVAASGASSTSSSVVDNATGTIEKLECNGKEVPLASGDMVDGVIVTREYGRVKIHIQTGLASPGIVDVGISPSRVRDIAVQQPFADAFTAHLR